MTAIVRTLHPRPVILVAGVLAAVAVTAPAVAILGNTTSLRPAIVGLVSGLATLFVADRARDRLMFQGGDTIRVIGAAGALLAVPAGLLTITVGEPLPIERLAGPDRIATAVAVSAEAFETADTVVLVDAGSAEDAVVAAPVATDVRGPLLLTSGTSLSEPVAAEIERLGATRAILVGGVASALRPASLADAGLRAESVQGPDRYATSAAAVARLRPDRVYVASSWVDAVGAPVADGSALLLIPADEVDAVAAAALRRSSPTDVVVLGGTDGVSDDVLTYLAALLPDADVERDERDRWERSLASFEESGHPTRWPWIASGTSWPDAVTAGVAAAADGKPLLLVPSRGAAPSAETVRWLERNRRDLAEVTVVGGESAVPRALVERTAR